MTSAVHAVTGAFGYTGKYITQRLLAEGKRVRTLTGHPSRPHPFGDRIEVRPLAFDHPDELAASLSGVDVLYNTYWVRFNHGQTTFDQAVANTRQLFAAARTAGVRRVVHISITNADADSPLPYFRGKGVLEKALQESGLSHAILRPTVIFGREDILINNIAWLLRRFPVFAVPGDGQYRLQPIYVEDLAALAVAAGGTDENQVVDAVGPEVFTFEELVRKVAGAVGARPWILHLPPGLTLGIAGLIGRWVGDVILTEEEVKGLMANLLVSSRPPTGQKRLGEWLAEHAQTVGTRYASELKRHYRSG